MENPLSPTARLVRSSLLAGCTALALTGYPLAGSAQTTKKAPATTAAPAASGPQRPVVTMNKLFKEWRMICERPQKAKQDQCYAVQNLVIKKTNQRLLNIAIGRLSSNDKIAAIVTFPLGISLPPGVAIKIDENKPIRFAIERCHAGGCVGAMAIDDKTLKSLKSGKQAKVSFRDPTRREIVVPVSLNGFTAAFKALPEPKAAPKRKAPLKKKATQ